MDQNFFLMAQSRANYYTAGSPVQFVRVELLKGDVTGEVAVCLTFKNVGTEPLTGFIIHFKCKDASGQILCEDDFYYEQLNVQPGELFGADDAVFVSDTPVSSVEIEQDRAFLNGKLSLTQAEAVMDIISADGRQGAALANASLNGALARKIAAQKDALTALQAHLAAWVDFPEEDVPELSQSHLCDVLGGVEQELDSLIQSYDAGAVLREGVDCAIVGKPNAGKSTLLNLLAGFDRAIVTPVAGTTRDVVEQAVQLGDVRLNLFDTAGLRQTEDEIEAEGIRRSWKKLDEARLILAVFDGSERPTREDLELAQRCAGRPAIALVNKEDKPTRFDAELIAPYFAMVLPVCCQEEGARKVIAAAVARLLGTNQIDPHAASLSGQRQLSAATRARDAVAGALDAAQGLGLDAVSVCVDDALDALCELTGENASEAVINEVFERFCVGK